LGLGTRYEMKETDGGFIVAILISTALYFGCQTVYELGKAHGAQHK